MTRYAVWDRSLTRRLTGHLVIRSGIVSLMILTAPGERNRNVKNNNASNFIKINKTGNYIGKSAQEQRHKTGVIECGVRRDRMSYNKEILLKS